MVQDNPNRFTFLHALIAIVRGRGGAFVRGRGGEVVHALIAIVRGRGGVVSTTFGGVERIWYRVDIIFMI